MSGGKHFDCFCANRSVVIIEMNLAFTLYMASSAPVAQSASQRTALSHIARHSKTTITTKIGGGHAII